MPLLGVNIDHVATLRQARQGKEPDPVHAAVAAESAGADCITVHLREDRRHIQDRDVDVLRQMVSTRLNLEMSVSEEITDFAVRILPDQATLVPERRQEVTTEGGLDVIAHCDRVTACCKRLSEAGIVVSLFIDPEPEQLRRSAEIGVPAVELHTGSYADAKPGAAQQRELNRLHRAAELAAELGLVLNLGHGLDYRNVIPVAQLPGANELNIGHSIIARSITVGLQQAVREMKSLISR